MTRPKKRQHWQKAINRRASTINACTANLAAQLERLPTDEELASMLAMSTAKLRLLRRR